MKKYKTYIIFLVIAVILYFLYQRYMVAKNITDKNMSEAEQLTDKGNVFIGQDSFGDPVSYSPLQSNVSYNNPI